METKFRTFIAIELGHEVRTLLEGYIRQLQKKYSAGIRWVQADHIHLTLKFLGDTSVEQMQRVSQTLDHLSVTIEPIPLQMEKTGAFPSWQHPRSIWIGLKPSTALQSLYQQLETGLAKLGIPPEGKFFTPHLTLCRVSDHADLQLLRRLSNEIQTAQLPDFPIWEANRVVYFKSRLQPGGPIYSSISLHEFAKETTKNHLKV